MTRPLALTALLAPLALAACNQAGTPTPQEQNLTTFATMPVGLNGADASGDQTDSLRYQENAAAGGDTSVSKIGTGAGSIGQSGAVEGGQQNPDAGAPVTE